MRRPDEHITMNGRVTLLPFKPFPALNKATFFAALGNVNEEMQMGAVVALCKIGKPAVKSLREVLNDKNELICKPSKH